MGVFVWFFIPETKGMKPRCAALRLLDFMTDINVIGMSLEKMDDLFGVTELVRQKEDVEHGENAAHIDANTDKATEAHIERAS